jgi:hypothetical protein
MINTAPATFSFFLSLTPSVSFYLSLDSVILHYPATNKKKRREYISNAQISYLVSALSDRCPAGLISTR